MSAYAILPHWSDRQSCQYTSSGPKLWPNYICVNFRRLRDNGEDKGVVSHSLVLDSNLGIKNHSAEIRKFLRIAGTLEYRIVWELGTAAFVQFIGIKVLGHFRAKNPRHHGNFHQLPQHLHPFIQLIRLSFCTSEQLRNIKKIQIRQLKRKNWNNNGSAAFSATQ